MQRAYGQESQVVLTTPILEGLDGVQKMSKSLGNAIGIHEPPLEMYGKIMSISDEMMWRYYELLTDVQVAEIEKMRRESHPMQAKKELARRIVADFHSAEAAAKAGEDWGRDFQQGEQVAERAVIPVGSIEAQNAVDREKPPWAVEEEPAKHLYLPDEKTIRADWDTFADGNWKVRIVKVEKLLLQLGLVSSMSEASRKLKEDAVTIRDEKMKGRYFAFVSVPTEAYVRVGRKKKIASIVL